MTDRNSYGTFSLGSPPNDPVVHLRSELPEIVAIGMDVIVDFIRETPPLGGPHAEMNLTTKRLHIVTPESEFTYEHVRPEHDMWGWYFVFKLVHSSNDSLSELLKAR